MNKLLDELYGTKDKLAEALLGEKIAEDELTDEEVEGLADILNEEIEEEKTSEFLEKCAEYDDFGRELAHVYLGDLVKEAGIGKFIRYLTGQPRRIPYTLAEAARMRRVLAKQGMKKSAIERLIAKRKMDIRDLLRRRGLAAGLVGIPLAGAGYAGYRIGRGVGQRAGISQILGMLGYPTE